MIIPVRCFTCGKVIAQKYNEFKQLEASGMSPDNIYKQIGISKICCKRMFACHVDVADHAAVYTTLPDKVTRTTSVDKERQYRAV